MSNTIKATERSDPDWQKAAAHQAPQPISNRERKLVAEWQPGAEIWGQAQPKLRLAFAPAS